MSAGPHSSLEVELQALSPRVGYPGTPDLATAVSARLRAERSARPAGAERAVRRPVGGRRTGLVWWPRAIAQLALAVVAVATVALIASPAARAAVASVFRRVPGIRVIIGAPKTASPAAAPATGPGPSAVPSVTPSAASSAAPSVTPAETQSPSFSPAPPLSTGLGTPSTLASARAKVPFAVGAPARLGQPDAVFFDPRVGRGMVTMRWKSGADLPDAGGGTGAMLTQFDTGSDPNFPYFFKTLEGSDATFEQVQINGGAGGWIEGGHRVDFGVPRDDGVRQVVSNRLAANTLIWLQNGVTMRLETALSRAAAIELAGTIR